MRASIYGERIPWIPLVMLALVGCAGHEVKPQTIPVSQESVVLVPGPEPCQLSQ